jgi:hypothetical protein
MELMTALASDFTEPWTHDPGDLTAHLVACSDLDEANIRAMFRLYASNYAETSDAVFRRDLAKKTHVLLLTQKDSCLRGFTTVELYSSNVAERPVRVLFSGDTIVDPAHWGSPALAIEWIRFAGTVERSDSLPLYWLLIVKGHRTYRFLPAFAKRYIPHHAFPDPPAERRMLSALAREKFGSDFDDATGVVHFPTPQGRLIDELADIPERHLRLGPVAHFLRLNPGYRAGDELVCLCRLASDNLRPFAARAFTAGPGRAN